MVRFFIPKNKIKNNIAVIDDEEYRHVKNVCRLREGDEIHLADGEGMVYQCVVKKVYKDKIEAAIVKQEKVDIESKIKFNLFQSVIKPDKFDLIIEKAVELGVSAITPVYTERTQYKLTPSKIERLNKIAKTAVCQCGRAFLPVINEPIKLIAGANSHSPLLQKISPKDITFFLNERETDPSNTIKNIFRRGCIYAARINQRAPTINLIIGPAGGFTKDEEDFLVKNGAVSITLGRRILRAETAVIAAMSILLSELGE